MGNNSLGLASRQLLPKESYWGCCLGDVNVMKTKTTPPPPPKTRECFTLTNGSLLSVGY